VEAVLFLLIAGVAIFGAFGVVVLVSLDILRVILLWRHRRPRGFDVMLPDRLD
jgi:hypothetical protein